jgi:periplasmic divalent cation tolerance protein
VGKNLNVSFVYTTVGRGTDPVLAPPGALPPTTVAERIATAIINEKLAFCANVIERVQSIYWDKGEVRQALNFSEVILQIKTLTENVDKVMARLREIHPYEVPMIWSVAIDKVDPIAFPWIAEAMGIDDAPAEPGTDQVAEVFAGG